LQQLPKKRSLRDSLTTCFGVKNISQEGCTTTKSMHGTSDDAGGFSVATVEDRKNRRRMQRMKKLLCLPSSFSEGLGYSSCCTSGWGCTSGSACTTTVCSRHHSYPCLLARDLKDEMIEKRFVIVLRTVTSYCTCPGIPLEQLQTPSPRCAGPSAGQSRYDRWARSRLLLHPARRSDWSRIIRRLFLHGASPKTFTLYANQFMQLSREREEEAEEDEEPQAPPLTLEEKL